MEISRLLAALHPRLVPFPIVLLLTALVLDGVALIRRNEKLHVIAKWFMATGTALLLLAFICGICAEIWAGRAGVPHLPIQIHELAATISAWGFIALGFLSFVIARMQDKRPLAVIAEHLAIASVVIVITHFVGLWIGRAFGA